MKNEGKTRELFSGKFGFVIACIGAALGLGNIWMFSYRLGQYGGAAFFIPYFIFTFLLGCTGLMGEFAFGRKMKAGSMTGIRILLKDKPIPEFIKKLLSYIPTIGLIGVFMFYTVVIGWVLKYFTLAVTGSLKTINVPAYFDSFAGSSQSIFWLLLAIVLTLLIVSLGVSNGIERANKIMIPLLFVIFIVLTFRSLTLPGSIEGVKYLFVPKWEALLNIQTWIMALGQAFFTVSLNGCGMVVYGSYIDKKVDIPSSTLSTAIFNTISAILASLMIIPAAFAFGLSPSAGPPLLFITVPQIFNSIPGGHILSIVFFFSVIIAALSSSINMLEGPVEALMSRLKWSRKKSSLILASISFILAIPLAINMNSFNSFSDFITIVVSPLGALIVAVLFFWVYGIKNATHDINIGCKHPISVNLLRPLAFLFIITTFVVIILGIALGGI